MGLLVSLRGALGTLVPFRTFPGFGGGWVNLVISMCSMARPKRLELPTLSFEDRYSIQLSYGRLKPARHSTGRSAPRRAQPCMVVQVRLFIFGAEWARRYPE